MISGYNWSGVQNWASLHPAGWINDPIDNFRYEAHHYWDADNSGVYSTTYSDNLLSAEATHSSYGTGAPTITAFSLNGPDTVTARNISATIEAMDDGDSESDLDVKISEYSDFRDAAWQPFKSPLPFTVSSSSGEKTLYAIARDSAGNTSPVTSLSLSYLPESESPQPPEDTTVNPPPKEDSPPAQETSPLKSTKTPVPAAGDTTSHPSQTNDTSGEDDDSEGTPQPTRSDDEPTNTAKSAPHEVEAVEPEATEQNRMTLIFSTVGVVSALSLAVVLFNLLRRQ
jgi:hypothetical protein